MLRALKSFKQRIWWRNWMVKIDVTYKAVVGRKRGLLKSIKVKTLAAFRKKNFVFSMSRRMYQIILRNSVVQRITFSHLSFISLHYGRPKCGVRLASNTSQTKGRLLRPSQYRRWSTMIYVKSLFFIRGWRQIGCNCLL